MLEAFLVGVVVGASLTILTQGFHPSSLFIGGGGYPPPDPEIKTETIFLIQHPEDISFAEFTHEFTYGPQGPRSM